MARVEQSTREMQIIAFQDKIYRQIRLLTNVPDSLDIKSDGKLRLVFRDVMQTVSETEDPYTLAKLEQDILVLTATVGQLTRLTYGEVVDQKRDFTSKEEEWGEFGFALRTLLIGLAAGRRLG